MSFSTSVSSISGLTFGPSRLDIKWDGVSNAKITVSPACSSTSTSTSYSVKVVQVFPADVEKVFFSSGATFNLAYSAGDPYRNDNYPTSSVAAPFVVGSTVVSSDVSFELSPSNNNFTSAFTTWDIPYPTAQTAYYKWDLTQTLGTASQVVVTGKIIRVVPNPYSEAFASGDLIDGATASFCIG